MEVDEPGEWRAREELPPLLSRPPPYIQVRGTWERWGRALLLRAWSLGWEQELPLCPLTDFQRFVVRRLARAAHRRREALRYPEWT